MPEPTHLASEFEFNAKGKVETVIEGTTDCTAARVFHVAVCPSGWREDNPSFGVPELAFNSVPLSLVSFEAAIRRWEPEASLEATEQALGQLQSQRSVNVEVS